MHFDNFKSISEDELLEIVTVTGLKCGFLKLVLKEYLSVFLPIWAHIINFSLSTGSKDNLKHATTVDFNKYENFCKELFLKDFQIVCITII